MTDEKEQPNQPESKLIVVNMNEVVLTELTSEALAHYESLFKDHLALPPQKVEVNENGLSQWNLWRLCRLFGPLFQQNGTPPFPFIAVPRTVDQIARLLLPPEDQQFAGQVAAPPAKKKPRATRSKK